MANVRKILTHIFDTEDTEITNFDNLLKDKLNKLENELNNYEIFTYNNKSTFAKNSVTNLIFNVGDNYRTAKKVIGLLGVSLGNQSLNLISYELIQKRESDNYKHDEYKIQVYNPTDADIVADVTIQLSTNGVVLQS